MLRFTLFRSLAMGGLLCAAAAASPIVFGFTGTVTQANFDPNHPFIAAVQFGSPIAGSFVFESTSPDLIAGPQQGSFQMAGPPFGVSFIVGGELFRIQGFLAINTFHSSVAQYGVLACSGDAACAGDLVFSLLLNDSTGQALSTDFLPTSPPELVNFDSAGFAPSGSMAGNQIDIEGTIDSLFSDQSPGVVPEPASACLCLIGLGSVPLWRRR